MKRLILLRHAKAVPAGTIPDHDRDLEQRGLREAAGVGRTLAAAGWLPDMALASDARRAQRTLEQALVALLPPPVVRIEPRLYDASTEQILACIATAPATAACLLVVGHNPGIAQTALALARGGDAKARTRLASGFPTAAVAVFTFEAESWVGLQQGDPVLEAFVAPS